MNKIYVYLRKTQWRKKRMNKIYVYLRNASETIKLTRDDCDNVSIECLYKGDRIYTWLGFSNDDLTDTIMKYIVNGYTLKSIY